MRTRKNTSKIILATIVAILATMISFSAFNNLNKQIQEQSNLIKAMKAIQNSRNQTYVYAVAVKDLKSGEVVSNEDIEFKDFKTRNYSAFDKSSDVVNKVLVKDIKSGDVFTSSYIVKVSNDSSVSLRPGYRALTLSANNFQGKSEKMVPGSVIDLYGTAGKSDWLLENIKIISFEKDKKSIGAANIMNAESITFEVKTSDVPEFISNVSKGRLMMVVRDPNDKKTVRKKKNNSKQTAVLPDLPAEVPITNLSGLPQPVEPIGGQPSVEVIEANVKSKVTFE